MDDFIKSVLSLRTGGKADADKIFDLAPTLTDATLKAVLEHDYVMPHFLGQGLSAYTVVTLSRAYRLALLFSGLDDDPDSYHSSLRWQSSGRVQMVKKNFTWTNVSVRPRVRILNQKTTLYCGILKEVTFLCALITVMKMDNAARLATYIPKKFPLKGGFDRAEHDKVISDYSGVFGSKGNTYL